jgi:hypothetical protein
MRQTTIVTTSVAGGLCAGLLFISPARAWYGSAYPNGNKSAERARHGLWATAVWGTKGIWAPDTVLEPLAEPISESLIERYGGTVN